VLYILFHGWSVGIVVFQVELLVFCMAKTTENIWETEIIDKKEINLDSDVYHCSVGQIPIRSKPSFSQI
jgi:hypothetical protein